MYKWPQNHNLIIRTTVLKVNIDIILKIILSLPGTAIENFQEPLLRNFLKVIINKFNINFSVFLKSILNDSKIKVSIEKGNN